MATTCFPDFLKSEIFWVALQSIAAVAGLLILLAYTFFTKRMKESTDRMLQLQLQMHRAEIAPEFTLRALGGSSNQGTDRNLHITVRNIGKGPALRFKCWSRPVDPQLELVAKNILPRMPSAEEGMSSNFEVLADELANTTFQCVDNTRYLLCVLECVDTGGYMHQFQLIRIPEPAAMDPWLMVHGWPTS